MLKHFRPGFRVLTLVLLSSFLFSFFGFTQTSFAAYELPTNSEIHKNLSTHQHYYFLHGCFARADIDEVPAEEVDSWDFFEGNSSNVVLGAMYNNKGGGYYKCSDEKVVENAFSYLGFTDSRDTFCSMPKSQFNGSFDQATCKGGVGDGHWDNKASTGELATWFETQAMSKKPNLGNKESYLRAYMSLRAKIRSDTGVGGCETTFVDSTLYDKPGDVPGTSAANKYAVGIVKQDDSGNFVKKFVQGVGRNDENANHITLVAKNDGSEQFISCKELAKLTTSTVDAYAAELNRIGSDGDTGQFDDETDPTTPGTTKCNVEGVGWMVCPVLSFIGKMNDLAYGFISDTFLNFEPSLLTDSGTMAAWNSFRNIANIFFVIFFLIIIYSQLTGAGLSNYGIKRLLPRIVVTAILVNISFFLCQIAVDISNLVGNSVVGFFGNGEIVQTSIESGASNTDTTEIAGVDGGWSESMSTGVVLGTAAIGLVLALTFGLPGLIVLALLVLALVMRKAIILLLVVIAPLAFVAYLLPNTEGWFKKWWKLFYTMLAVYPVIGVVFGASALAARIIAGSADSADNADKWILQLTALGVSVIPLFAIPAVVKGSMAGLGALGAKINGWQNKAQGSAGSRGKERYGQSALGQWNKYRASEAQKRRALTQAGQYRGWNPIRKSYSAVAKKANRSRATGQFGDRLAAGGISMANKEEAEAISLQEALIANDMKTNPNAHSEALRSALQSGDTTKARAAQNHLLKSAGGREAFHDVMGDPSLDAGDDMSEALRANIQANHADIDSKDAALTTWAFKGGTLAAVRADAATWETATDAQLAGHSKKSLEAIHAAGHLDHVRAQRIINDPRLAANIKPDEKTYLGGI